jgi:6-pyruvoyltetrahydropterin/6-carboxytetrahydropterin synthase
MYHLELSTHFSAAHALVIRGWREPLHGHDWHVTVRLEGPALDNDGLLCDFHHVLALLAEVVTPFQNANLNDAAPFSRGVNPSAEQVARHIAEALSERLETRGGNEPKDVAGSRAGESGGPGVRTFAPLASVRVASVRVTEAVGCAATYICPVVPDPQ